MRRMVPYARFLLYLTFSLASLWAQETSQSLGDVARKERERKQAQAQAARQTVESQAVGLRLKIPREWTAKENRNAAPFPSQLVVNCHPESEFGCLLMAESDVLPSSKTTITDADRQTWDTGNAPPGSHNRRVSARDFTLDGYPGYDLVLQSESYPMNRTRYVYVLGRDVGRLFKFTFNAQWEFNDHFDEYAPAIDQVIQSFSPLGHPTAEEMEVADVVSSWKPEEQHVMQNLFAMLFIEELCKGIQGSFVSIEQMVKGCKGQAGTAELEAENNPRSDPNYDYRLAIQGEVFELSATPRRGGLGGFFFDGRKVYFNPQGQASNTSKALYDLGSAGRPGQPATAAPSPPPSPPAPAPAGPPSSPQSTAARAKKVWTEDDLRGLQGTINVGVGGTSTSPAGNQELSTSPKARPDFIDNRRLKPVERIAYEYLIAVSMLEDSECKKYLHRICSLEELVRGVEVEPGRSVGFRNGIDPRADPNYEIQLTAVGDEYQISATPRSSKVGGLLTVRGGSRYNPEGKATSRDIPVTGPVSVGLYIRHR